MTVRKLSISVPPEIEEIIRAAAHDGVPVSAWLVEAAEEKAARHAQALAAAQEIVAEYEAERGALPEESRRRAREFMLDAGLMDESRLAG